MFVSEKDNHFPGMEDAVEKYSTTGPTLLHQPSMLELLQDGQREEEGDYARSLCGGLAERSSSTIEIPDIDINARFSLNSNWIKVKKSEMFGSFLYEIE